MEIDTDDRIHGLFARKNHRGDLFKMKIKKLFLPLILILCILLSGCFLNPSIEKLTDEPNETFFKENNGFDSAFSIKDIPEFSVKPYVVNDSI